MGNAFGILAVVFFKLLLCILEKKLAWQQFNQKLRGLLRTGCYLLPGAAEVC